MIRSILFLCLLSINSVTAQSVNIESLRINDEIPVVTTFIRLLDAKLIDEVVESSNEFKEVSFLTDSLVLSGKSCFEIRGRTIQTATLNTLVFDDRLRSLSIGDHVVSGKTTITEFRKWFPELCDTKHMETRNLPGRAVLSCSIPMINYSKSLTQRIRFNFRKGKLYSVDFTSPI